ncbi:hypothetical protein BPAE_0099g00360 [Botrytis paeoniae]|uniref:Major facilitator superfamily (MFS) profile domain-containing protein n=1 Tax=Botrytis paeoniae TaxID=278948 RepID=A0A4Z1FM20_9HELO|nr:hypothetical protein BPAE_0099g00360 [Botrytis paeoniae]
MTSSLKSERETPSCVQDNDTEDHKKCQSPEDNVDSFPISDKSWKSILSHVAPIVLVCLLVWLDEGILATAIPSISDEFKSFDQIGWYGPSYLFGLCASQLPFGRAYKDFPTKVTYMFSLLIFEVASIIQAAAPSSAAFIVGRIFAGMGGAGVLAGSLTIFSEEIPKAKLPYIMGAFGLVQSVGGIAGPTIGGAITSSSLTWRWCFYLNPIISAVALAPVLFLWKGKFVHPSKNGKPTTREVFAKFDYPGIIAFTAAIVALLLGLQFGGSSYKWSDRRTIVSGVLFVSFFLLEWWQGDNAILPSKILGTRVVALASVYTATLDGAYFVLMYQIPLWFQTIYGLSARESGYRIIPLVASCILAGIVGTVLTGKLRYYHPFMLVGAMLLTIGSGLLTTLHPTASNKWVGYEILAGAGTGLGSPLPLLAVQDALLPSDVSIGYGVVLTAGYLLSSIALAIAQAVFASLLKSAIHQQLPGIDPENIGSTGVTDLKLLFPDDVYEQGLRLYNKALTQSWYISAVLAAISVFLVLGLK